MEKAGTTWSGGSILLPVCLLDSCQEQALLVNESSMKNSEVTKKELREGEAACNETQRRKKKRMLVTASNQEAFLDPRHPEYRKMMRHYLPGRNTHNTCRHYLAKTDPNQDS